MNKRFPKLARALASIALVVAAAQIQNPADEPRLPVTVLAVRHAEAAATTPDEPDPGLTAAGAQRARALDRLLAAAGVTHLFSSEYRRTRDTLAPFAERLSLEIEAHPARERDALAATLRALPPGSVALVAGHSNTVPALVAALGGTIEGLEQHPTHGPLLGHDEHGRLFATTLPGGPGTAPRTIELRYGAPTDD